MFVIIMICVFIACAVLVQLKKTINNAIAAKRIDEIAEYERRREIDRICGQH